MTKVVIILVAVTALLWAVPASAQLVAHPRCQAMACREASQTQNLKHARYLCHHGRHATKRWGCQAIRWLTRELHKTEAVLHPRVVAASHWSGWNCITTGDGHPGQAHEGNGYNGAYAGPLGMTDPWAGYASPGSDWVHTPVSVVYAIAEKVAAQHNFADWWMRQQWPNTYPPCAGYFR